MGMFVIGGTRVVRAKIIIQDKLEDRVRDKILRAMVTL